MVGRWCVFGEERSMVLVQNKVKVKVKVRERRTTSPKESLAVSHSDFEQSSHCLPSADSDLVVLHCP